MSGWTGAMAWSPAKISTCWPTVLLAGGGVGPPRALDVELQLDRVVVHAVLEGVLVRARLLVPLHELVQAVLAALERDEAQPVAQHLVLDHARVVVDPDVLDGEGGDLGDHDAAEGVGDGGVEPDEAEGGVMLAVLVEDDAELVPEGFDVPGVVLAGVVAGEVGRGDVCDCFCVDADDLGGRWSVNGPLFLQNAEFGEQARTHFPAVKLLWRWYYYGCHLFCSAMCCVWVRRCKDAG
jgi:hypothetical protein